MTLEKNPSENPESVAAPALPAPIKRPGNHTSDAVIHQRRKAIMIILDNIERAGKIWDEEIVLTEMHKSGWQITKEVLKDDIKILNEDNSFVIDLSRTHYSRMVEYCYQNIKLSVRECNKIISQTWANSKQVTKEVISDGDDGNKMIREDHRTMELAGPRLKAIDIRNKSIEMLLDVLKGGIVDVGVAQMDIDFGRIKLEIQELNDNLVKYEEKYGKLPEQFM